MIEAQSVSKKYGSRNAIINATFTIHKGESVAFLGRSGAGKTTLLNILAGYICASDGTITVDGIDIFRKPLKVRKRIAYLTKDSPLYPYMTVSEYLRYVCDIRHVDKERRYELKADAYERLKLNDKQNCLIKSLPKADCRRTALAGVLCTDSDIIILDEPTAGLEPDDVAQIRSVILGISKTLIVASSNIQEVTALCDHVIIMRDGTIVGQDALKSFSFRANSKKRVWVRLKAGRATGLSLLNNIDGVDSVECVGSKEPDTFDYIVDTLGMDVRAEIFKTAAKASVVLLGLKPMSVTLEDVFYQLTCQSGGIPV